MKMAHDRGGLEEPTGHIRNPFGPEVNLAVGARLHRVFIHIELVCIQNETCGGVSVRFDQVPRRRTNPKMMKKNLFY